MHAYYRNYRDCNPQRRNSTISEPRFVYVKPLDGLCERDVNSGNFSSFMECKFLLRRPSSGQKENLVKPLIVP